MKLKRTLKQLKKTITFISANLRKKYIGLVGLSIFVVLVIIIFPGITTKVSSEQTASAAHSVKLVEDTSSATKADTSDTKKQSEQKYSDADVPLLPNNSGASVSSPAPPPVYVFDPKAAYMYDFTTGQVLFSKNSDEVLPLASITKLMTAYVALSKGQGTDPIIVSSEALSQDGDSGLYLNEKWTLDDLLKYTLIVSSNDGAAAIAENVGRDLAMQSLNIGSESESASSTDEIQTINSTPAQFIQPTYATAHQTFINAMNEGAISLGLSKTRFLNESGLDISNTLAGSYGSARDVASLLYSVYQKYPQILSVTSESQMGFTSLDGINHNAVNTDVITNKISSLLAGKTGYTGLAGGNLAVLFKTKQNHTIAVVVLGSTYYDRFTDIETLIKGVQ